MAQFKPLDLTGRRFGRLIAVTREEKQPGGGIPRWICRCDCGGEKIAEVSRLQKGHVASCGCKRREHAANVGKSRSPDLTGQRFGRLTPISRVEGQGGRLAWLCACDCGSKKIFKGLTLRAQRAVSCGCAAIDKPGLTPQRERERARAKQNSRRALAKQAGGTFTQADVDALFKLQRGCCANCRKKLPAIYHRDHKMPLALGGANDIGNIELLCPRCNIAKNATDPIVWAQRNGRLL